MLPIVHTAIMLPLLPYIFINSLFNTSIVDNIYIPTIPTQNTISNNSTFISIVNDTKGNQIVSFDCPGLSKEDINITILNDVLTISGYFSKCIDPYIQNNNNLTLQSNKYICNLYKTREFYQTFHLPYGVQSKSIFAKIVDGIITVMYPLPSPQLINIQ